MDIEEAQHNIFRAATDMRLLEREATADTVAKVEARLNDAARALALAVLEEAEGEGLEMLFPEVLLARIVAIRARIEALGKEGT